MDTLVIDSSVFIKWLNKKDEDNLDKANLILEDTRNGKVELLAPELARYEVGNVLLKSKKLTPQEANVSLGPAYSLPITFVSETEDLAKQTFELAFKKKITYYDASFMSLAKQYNATLVTDDLKDQGKDPEIKTKPLKDY
ncbi:MAG: type II toxin-antitoxin system VapC family toxin [Candidatus Woykebacteria bacterium]